MYESGLPKAQKSIIERKSANGVVNIKKSDQVQAVKEILDVIAYGKPITIVSRIIISLNKVMKYHLKNNEKLLVFVPRFHGLASERVMIADDGEIISIKLLNNANLLQ